MASTWPVTAGVLVAVALAVAAPVAPVGPELPLRATGLDSAALSASPVSPELVALDWAVAAPLPPEVATGVAVELAAPPEPPLAAEVATVLPPPAGRRRRRRRRSPG